MARLSGALVDGRHDLAAALGDEGDVNTNGHVLADVANRPIAKDGVGAADVEREGFLIVRAVDHTRPRGRVGVSSAKRDAVEQRVAVLVRPGPGGPSHGVLAGRGVLKGNGTSGMTPAGGDCRGQDHATSNVVSRSAGRLRDEQRVGAAVADALELGADAG